MKRYTTNDIAIRDRLTERAHLDIIPSERMRYVASLPEPGRFAYGAKPSEARDRLIARGDREGWWQ